MENENEYEEEYEEVEGEDWIGEPFDW